VTVPELVVAGSKSGLPLKLLKTPAWTSLAWIGKQGTVTPVALVMPLVAMHGSAPFFIWL
jgi:hypothetical protein